MIQYLREYLCLPPSISLSLTLVHLIAFILTYTKFISYATFEQQNVNNEYKKRGKNQSFQNITCDCTDHQRFSIQFGFKTDYGGAVLADATCTFGMSTENFFQTDILIAQHISITSVISFLSNPISSLVLKRNDTQYLSHSPTFRL